ncbi:hypothetical protein NSZ01_16700 [Nocardioides szechwanensis]|uniref:Hemolysin-type calcium-binding repeat-containing protein n=1 Tax=Nocardioides szechwanensis TaxID=1005944 RepID=A0A1G9ZFL1_9ACTN|nr:hypothetical protein [Nocardioides szechwanensis]GEP33902.1 hypothetical protein NSZ01_16700 [Nocardioides szechwanensis]SDN19396.1 hypothetical protein SAMN05192576_1699 [Nocardioides szechwanensis]
MTVRTKLALTVPVAAMLTLGLLPPTASGVTDSAPVATCLGERATLVGSPATRLKGTPRRDVIVSNGAGRIEALGGDDLICITGLAENPSSWVLVHDGPGDDRIDASALGTRRVVASLQGGDDTYWGGPGPDSVHLAGGGRDRVRTRGGDDSVGLGDERPGPRPDLVDLGPGADAINLRITHTGPRGAAVRVRGGHGRDRFDIRGKSDRPWSVGARAGRATEGARLQAPRLDFSSFETFDLVVLRTPSLRFVGSDKSEDIWLSSPSEPGSEAPWVVVGRKIDVQAGGGDDSLLVSAEDRGPIAGGGGDNALSVVDVFGTATVVADLAGGAIDLTDFRDPTSHHLLAVDAFPDLDLWNFADFTATGDSGDNRLQVYGCEAAVHIDGGPGDDTADGGPGPTSARRRPCRTARRDAHVAGQGLRMGLTASRRVRTVPAARLPDPMHSATPRPW